MRRQSCFAPAQLCLDGLDTATKLLSGRVCSLSRLVSGLPVTVLSKSLPRLTTSSGSPCCTTGSSSSVIGSQCTAGQVESWLRRSDVTMRRVKVVKEPTSTRRSSCFTTGTSGRSNKSLYCQVTRLENTVVITVMRRHLLIKIAMTSHIRDTSLPGQEQC